MTTLSFSRSQLIRLLLVLAIATSALLPLAQPAQAASVVDAKLDSALVSALDGAGPNTPFEVIIVLDDVSLAAQVQSLAASFYQMEVLPMVSAVLTKSQIEEVSHWPGVFSITLNAPLQYFLAESIPYIGADRVWTTYGQTGGNTTVAVLDSGIDATHPDLLYGYHVIQNVKIVPNGPAVEGVLNTDTSSGHGTHVAGTIGGGGVMSDGYYRGVAPDVNLVGVGAGEALFILTAVQGYDWILAHHAEYNIRVISNSWGSSGGSLNVRNPVVIATYEAYKRGILSVFAAGNDGGYDIVNPYSIAPWVLSVAAGDKSGHLASFSSRGLPGDEFKHPDIMAPGVDIYSTRCSCIGITALDPFPNPVNPAWTAHYTKMSGTSMATPHVSGSAALLFSGNPSLSPDQVIDLLVENVTPHVEPYPLWQAGYGYLNAFDAYVASRSLQGNLSAFLAGDRNFDINGVLGIDPDNAQYRTSTFNGYHAAGVTTMAANEYAVTFGEDTLFISIDLTWDPQAEDAYDMEVVDSQGRLVVSSGEGPGQAEAALFIPSPGESYTVRVVPFAAVDATYTLVVRDAYAAN